MIYLYYSMVKWAKGSLYCVQDICKTTIIIIITVEPHYSNPLNSSHLTIAANSLGTYGLIDSSFTLIAYPVIQPPQYYSQ